MPANVIRFEIAAYLGLLVGGLVVLMVAPNARINPLEGAILTALVWALAAALIHLAAQRRKNWARWTYGVLVVVSAMSVVFDVANGAPDGPWAAIVSVLSSVLELTAVYFSFTGDAVPWFERNAAKQP